MKTFIKSSKAVWVQWFYSANFGEPTPVTRENMYQHILERYSFFDDNFWAKATFNILDGDELIQLSAKEVKERALKES